MCGAAEPLWFQHPEYGEMWYRGVAAWLVQMVEDLSEEQAPITYSLVVLGTAVFLAEIVATFYYGLSSMQVFATGIFGVYPGVAWLLSPLLHRDPFHFLGNMVVLVFAGAAVERHWTRWRYIGFLIGSGYGATAAGAVLIHLFAGGQIAFYGLSGVGFALAGFALSHLPWSHLRLSRPEWFAVGIGFLALLTVVVDPFTDPYLHYKWINGGHLAGFVLGVYAGKAKWAHCDLGWV